MPGPTENRILRAVPDPTTHTVRLLWRGGAETVADFSHLVGKGVFKRFENPAFFSQVTVSEDGYALAWTGGLDFSADSLWFKAHPEDNPFAVDPSSQPRAARR